MNRSERILQKVGGSKRLTPPPWSATCGNYNWGPARRAQGRRHPPAHVMVTYWCLETTMGPYQTTVKTAVPKSPPRTTLWHTPPITAPNPTGSRSDRGASGIQCHRMKKEGGLVQLFTRARQLLKADLQARTGLTYQTTGGGNGQSGHWKEAESGPSVRVRDHS